MMELTETKILAFYMPEGIMITKLLDFVNEMHSYNEEACVFSSCSLLPACNSSGRACERLLATTGGQSLGI